MQIYVKNHFEGLHRWKDAPEAQKFIRDYHRHIFYCVTTAEVFEDDRDIEFFALKSQISEFWNSKKQQLGEGVDWSCEQMAKMLLTYLHKIYPGRCLSVDISEDNENGAVVTMLKNGEII